MEGTVYRQKSIKNGTLFGRRVYLKLFYTPESENAITEHEDEMLAKYSEIIQSYALAFAKYNCTLRVGRVWASTQKMPLEGTEADSRLPFEDGYACYVYCNVERNGKTVRYDMKDGEADYYDLSMSWNVTSITYYSLRLFEGIEDVIETMDHFMDTISSPNVEFIAY